MQGPAIFFFVSGGSRNVSAESDLWKRFLLDPGIPPAQNGSPSSDALKSVTIGDYLTAAQQFLSRDDFYPLRCGLNHFTKMSMDHWSIKHVNLYLEKHGAFYHPVRVETTVDDGARFSFVLNGAVSRQGLALLRGEYRLIGKLNQNRKNKFLPHVFSCGKVDTKKGDIAFFLGEWFDGYKEFHLTEDKGRRQVVVWGGDGQCDYLEENASFGIYQEVATILTRFYNLETFKQVFPWHHAAGDFIIRPEKDGYKVKLITARGYQNLTDFDPDDDNAMVWVLPALMVFFLQLTLRVRMDRLNGTGTPALVDEKVIPYIISGFFKGLNEKDSENHHKLSDVFTSFITELGGDQLMEIVGNVIEPLQLTGDEKKLICRHLEPHLKKVVAVLNNR